MRKLFRFGFIVVAATILGIPSLVDAKTIYFGEDTVTVPIVYGSPTLFRFPLEVKTISQAQKFEVSPANPEQPNFALLSVRPRFVTGVSDVAFILSDGTLVRTRIKTLPQAGAEKADAIYDFKLRESAAPGEDDTKSAHITEFDLMRSMLRGEEASGYDMKAFDKKITPGFKGVSTKLVRVYTGSNLKGYIFELANTTRKQKLFIDVRNLTLGEPNVAILSSVDDAVLEPESAGARSKTYLRIVSKPNTLYNQLILPVQTVEKKEAQ